MLMFALKFVVFCDLSVWEQQEIPVYRTVLKKIEQTAYGLLLKTPNWGVPGKTKSICLIGVSHFGWTFIVYWPIGNPVFMM